MALEISCNSKGEFIHSTKLSYVSWLGPIWVVHQLHIGPPYLVSTVNTGIDSARGPIKLFKNSYSGVEEESKTHFFHVTEIQQSHM